MANSPHVIPQLFYNQQPWLKPCLIPYDFPAAIYIKIKKKYLIKLSTI